MWPVSPVFHIVVTVSIGLKNLPRVRKSIQYYTTDWSRIQMVGLVQSTFHINRPFENRAIWNTNIKKFGIQTVGIQIPHCNSMQGTNYPKNASHSPVLVLVRNILPPDLRLGFSSADFPSACTWWATPVSLRESWPRVQGPARARWCWPAIRLRETRENVNVRDHSCFSTVTCNVIESAPK